MPVISIWMLRIPLIFLVTTFVAGSVLLLNKAFGWSPALWALLPLHIEAGVLGWILQFVLGTAYWMFPRYVKGPNRGDKNIAWVMLVVLNTGILFSAISFGNQWFLFGGRLLLLAGVALFARLMWGRIVSYRNL